MTHKQSSGEFEAITIREFSDNEMVTTFKAGSVVAVRKFKKVCKIVPAVSYLMELQ